MSKKEAKSEALKKKLGNVIECKECGSKKHRTKDHEEEGGKDDKNDTKEEDKEVDSDKVEE